MGTGKRERTTGNRGESGHDKSNEKKREVQGQPEAVFPPRSLSGSGATRKLAGSTHCKKILARKLTPTHHCFLATTFTRGIKKSKIWSVEADILKLENCFLKVITLIERSPVLVPSRQCLAFDLRVEEEEEEQHRC